MKKTLFNLIIVVIAIVAFSSCTKDETKKNEFNYPMEILYGTWEGTDINIPNYGWISLNNPLFYDYQVTIKFNRDNTYYGSGYFGNGYGTYTAKGNIIVTYVDGEEYLRYEVKSLNNNVAELIMMQGTSKIEIKAKKK